MKPLPHALRSFLERLIRAQGQRPVSITGSLKLIRKRFPRLNAGDDELRELIAGLASSYGCPVEFDEVDQSPAHAISEEGSYEEPTYPAS